MNRFFKNLAATTALVVAGLFGGLQANAIGWPANYDGVMLQGFYWDSFNNGAYGNTKWSTLTAMADELSQYFDLIWVPNSGKPASSPSNGYDPVYWFTNHNSSFGTQNEIRTLISTYKAKGVGIIEDCVINHRSGATNWYNFPAEQWNGKTYQLLNGSITSGDEVWSAGQNCPSSYRGNADTGEDFNGSRDLDHTNATVQENCKAYVNFLLNDMGYAGLRYDMVKGYSGTYTKMYNQANNVQFSVGEYWDGNYDAVAAWIESTGKTSAAFDFPCKYQINKALGGGENLTELVWKANGTTNQPAGMIHFGYSQYAVTFVDNHDTFRDGSKFTGNVMMANAFILMSPGTPCVFWPHYYSNKSAMQALIKARKAVGIHNNSAVNVLQSSGNLYVAEVTGKKGKAIVKIGSGNYNAPSGYNLATSGNNYAVWTTTQGGVTPGGGGNQGGGSVGGSTPSKLYIMGNIEGANWSTSNSPAMTKSGDKFTASVKLVPDAGETKCFFSFTDALGSSWDELNAAANRYGAASNNKPISNNSSDSMTAYLNNVDASGCQSWSINPGTYTITADFSNMTVTVGTAQGGGNQGGGNQGGNTGSWTIYFDNSASNWSTVNVYAYSPEALGTWAGTPMTKDATSGYYKLTTNTDLSGLNLIFNNGGSSQTGDDVKAVNNGIYKYVGEKVGNGVYQGTYSGGGNQGGGNQGGGDNPGTYPATVYMMGNVDGADWSPSAGTAATGNNGVYTYNVTIDDAGEGVGYFAFATVLGPDWDADVNSGNRYGAPAENTPIADGETKDVTLYAANVNASASQSWMITAGKYKVTLNLANMTVTIGDNGNQGGGNQGGGNQGGGDNPGTYPATVYMMGNVDGADWSPSAGTSATGNNGVYTYNVTIDDAGEGVGYFAFATVLGPDWDADVNSGNRYGAPAENTPIADGETKDVTLYEANVNASASQSWMIAAGKYKVTLNLANMTVTIGDNGNQGGGNQGGGNQGGGDNPGTYPATVYIMGNVDGADWKPANGTPATGNNGVYSYNVTIDDAGAGYGYFAFATVLGPDWDADVNSGDRYGAPAKDTPIAKGQTEDVTLYAAGVNASASESWMLAAGKYNITLNLATMKVSVGEYGTSGIDGVDVEDVETVYFNLSGMKMTEPLAPGVYIRVKGTKADKIMVK